MLKRFAFVALAAMLLLGESGCCACRNPLQGLCTHKWGCNSCGERYWGEWFGDPPECCDPCNRCGDFTGPGCKSCVKYGGGHAPIPEGGYEGYENYEGHQGEWVE